MNWHGKVRALARDVRGSVALYVALGTMVFLPVAAIAIDLSSLMALQTEVQQAAEAAALAGAKELDYTDDGLVAAETAAKTAVTNFQALAADAGNVVDIQTVTFLWALPPDGQTNYELYTTTDADEARYIRTVTEPRLHVSGLLTAFLAIWTGDGNAAAQNIVAGAAVAGRTAVACRTLPLMMCNPAEPGSAIADALGGSNKFGDFLKANPRWTRAQYRIKWIGPGASFGPGTFGLLEPMISPKPGAKGIEDELALNIPSFCVTLNGATIDPDIRTGQAATVVDGLNVRFDIFEGNWKSEKNSAAYPPAPNVTKAWGKKAGGGGGGNPCNVEPKNADHDPTSDYQALPRDPCFTNSGLANCFPFDGTIDKYSALYGANNGYSLYDYFRVNHPGDISGGAIKAAIFNELVAKEIALNNEIGMPLPPAATQTSPVSRYTVYRWEIDKASNIPGSQTQQGGLPKEEGRPQCNKDNVGSPDRRLLYIAVVNCQQQAEEIAAHGRVTVREFAEGFMSETPIHGQGPAAEKGAIFVEVRRTIEQGSAANIVLRDVVQLY
jgi:Flp pilus assembly protein TadG